MLTRRHWLQGSVVAAAMPAARAAGGVIAIASANGERACARAVEWMRAGQDTLDAVIAGVSINEEDPSDSSVGYGGLPNEEGVVELDSCVMHGPTRRAGSVAALRNIKTPSKVAQRVMNRTDHVMLVGEGALRFARAQGFVEENLLTERARKRWLQWKESGGGDWGPGLDRPTGTINCLGRNASGEMSGVTTTSGLAWKIPGRVGDSPIIGAGLFVDQDVGAAGSTGRGEEAIRTCGAHSVVENMRHGMPPADAVLDVLERVRRNYNDDRERLARFNIRFYALRNDGACAGGSLWRGETPARFAVNDGGESRLEECVYLME